MVPKMVVLYPQIIQDTILDDSGIEADGGSPIFRNHHICILEKILKTHHVKNCEKQTPEIDS